MSRNMYAKPTTTNASFLKIPMNLSSTEVAELTWGDIVNAMPILKANGDLPVKAIKLGAITVGGSPDAPAHLEFKGGQTFDLPALATKPMRVKASEKNLYVTGWRRISKDNQNALHVSSNTDDDDLTSSVVMRYQGQIAYIEVALRFFDDAGYRPWYTGGDLPDEPYEVYYLAVGSYPSSGSPTVRGYRTLLAYTETDICVVGDEIPFSSEAQASELLATSRLIIGLRRTWMLDTASNNRSNLSRYYYASTGCSVATVDGVVTITVTDQGHVDDILASNIL